MSDNNSGAISPYDRSSATEAIESFTQSITEALAQSDASESVLSDVQESGDALAQTIDETVAHQSETIAEQDQHIDELGTELKEERETVDDELGSDGDE